MKSSARKKIVYGGIAGAVILAICLFFLLRPSGSGTYENLIRNGDFELVSNGLPSSWEPDAYFPQTSYTDYDLGDGVTGKAGHIQNHFANDARFAQTVSVSPNTLYCLHGFIKADAKGGLGANLSIEGVYVFSQSLYDTENGWQEVSLYGRTGEDQRTVTVYARLGGYSGEATGDAWFDDITLNRVDAVPSGFRETTWYAAPAASGKDAASSTGSLFLILSCILYASIFAWMVSILKKSGHAGLEEKSHLIPLGAVLLLGLAVRCAAAALIPGYDVDIDCFRSWADFLFRVGPARFYQEISFCDYPPGYLWVLWLLGAMGKLLGTGVTGFMVKIPPILADMILCVLLYREGKKLLSEKAALCLTVLYALNPLVLATSAAWGQADAVMLLLIFLTVLFALKGKWAAALPIYMAAVLVKPQSLLFGPLGLAAFVCHLIQTEKDPEKRSPARKDALLGLGLTVAAALLLAGPFLLYQEKPFSWIVELYQNTMGQYGYVTVNACNLYFLLGKNWMGADSLIYSGAADGFLPAMIVFLTAALPLLAACIMRWSQWKQEKKSRLRACLFACLAGILGIALLALGASEQLSYAALGTVMIVFTVILFVLLYVLGSGVKNLPLLGAGLLLVLFNTGTMMHERYLFPAVGLLLLSYALKKDRRILYLAAAVSLTGFLNVGCALDRNIRIGGAAGHLNAPYAGISSDMTALEMLSAAGNCLLGSCALYLSAILCWEDAPVASLRLAPSQSESHPEAYPSRVSPLPVSHAISPMTKKDWAVMAVATVLYAVLALTNLGALKSPQTAWVSRQEDEAVTIDLGKEQRFYMLYYPGIHWRSDWESAQFSVQVSRDGETWEDGFYGSVKSGDTFDCFHWKYVSGAVSYGLTGDEMTGRYVRIVSQFPELTLYEVLFRDADTDEFLPVSSIQDAILLRDAETGELLKDQSETEPFQNETSSFLIDEQDAFEGDEPSWYNSTYFDEIYHARTAYEHLHGLPVYENTHPPLGKVLMSFAIAIFGMTPFGWRFAGALAGILMLPGMYLLGKLLIRKKWGGIAALSLMALDLMHFTQTRIATIDSFVVLFIIWAVYFMLRWFFLDAPGQPLKKTLVPLGLSGLFMGLAIASKWTGCYAGAGLAALFFYGIWRRVRAALAERKAEEESKKKKKKESASLWEDPRIRRILLTVASCFIFFIAVPLLIYYASYIPYFAPEGGVTAQKIIRAAEHMLSYHSTPGLGMDHSFYSPWYQWPVIAKPMWYYSGSFDADGTASTIMAMGNPAVWWAGLAGLLGVIGLFIRRHYDEKRHVLSLYAPDDDPRFALLLICFAAQYLPWVPVPRGTYIYHYFPSVPFIILCGLLCLDLWAQKHEKAARIAVIVWIVISAVLFAAFFPYASGVTVSASWLEAMKWFPRWLWY